MTLTSDFEKKLRNLNKWLKAYLGRIQLGILAQQQLESRGKHEEAQESLKELGEYAVRKGAPIIGFLQKCTQEAKALPALLAAEVEQRKLPFARARLAQQSAAKATVKLADFFENTLTRMENIVMAFGKGRIPSVDLDTLRIYMVNSPEMERSYIERLLSDLAEAEADVYAPVHENANA